MCILFAYILPIIYSINWRAREQSPYCELQAAIQGPSSLESGTAYHVVPQSTCGLRDALQSALEWPGR